MTHYSVSECLQNPQFSFCFDFGEIHSGSDASRGPSEVKYSAKVHVRSALCHLFGVREARNCSWYLFYAESVTLHFSVLQDYVQNLSPYILSELQDYVQNVSPYTLSELQDYVQNMSPYTRSELQDYVQNLSPYTLSELQDYVQNMSPYTLSVTRLCAESVTYTHIPPFIKICKNKKNQPPKYFYMWYYCMQNLSSYTLTKWQYYVQNLSPTLLFH
jgi:hypothetical protein